MQRCPAHAKRGNVKKAARKHYKEGDQRSVAQVANLNGYMFSKGSCMVVRKMALRNLEQRQNSCTKEELAAEKIAYNNCYRLKNN